MKPSSSNILQCCMCGDSGIITELFRCKLCHFRSQHRYCSNLYPKSESYKVCNWCLNQKEKSQDSLNSSSSCKIKNLKVQKPMLEEKISPRTKRKRIMTTACVEENLIRRAAKEMTKNGVITRHGFRNKVRRRYKLLDEVAS